MLINGVSVKCRPKRESFTGVKINKKIIITDELDDANLAIKKSTEESIRLRNEISQAQILVQEKASHVETLKGRFLLIRHLRESKTILILNLSYSFNDPFARFDLYY